MSKSLTLLSLKYCYTKIKNENPCASFYDELFSSYRKRDKRRKEEKSWETHKYHSQNARINLIILEFLWKYILMFFSTQEVWPLFT